MNIVFWKKWRFWKWTRYPPGSSCCYGQRSRASLRLWRWLRRSEAWSRAWTRSKSSCRWAISQYIETSWIVMDGKYYYIQRNWRGFCRRKCEIKLVLHLYHADSSTTYFEQRLCKLSVCIGKKRSEFNKSKPS